MARGADHPTGADADLDLGSEGLGPDQVRFEIRRRLGAGGFGTVYEVFDRERNAVVALKTLERHDGRALYRFKQEFRALSDLAHPNLVQLYELHGGAGRWFFTMELVLGQDAYAFAQASGHGSPDAVHRLESQSTSPAPVEEPRRGAREPDAPGGPRAHPTFDEIKLRALFRQLAEGLCFLHRAGRLHRDVKPSNVMVTRDGRVVLLDFGLVVDLAAEGDQSVGAAAGTPHYMAPEQAGGDAIGPPADWYAVGVMLYRALAGRLPFVGNAVEILGQKITRDPDPPTLHVEGVPDDLNRLCMDLLQRAPELRPSGDEVLERLSPGAEEAPARSPDGPGKSDAAFVGRAAELAALREAFDAARAGRTAAVLVHGRSGMGKSALAGRFLGNLREADAGVVVLAGRCFEQESVPYKALDSLIDALGRRLAQMPPAAVDAILPRDVAMLARLFPALGRIPAVREAPRRAESADKLELRRRAFAALRELFARLGDRRTLVVFIDDVQWGDADGGALLADLLRPPDAPVMLFIAAYRTEESERSECLRVLLPTLRAAVGQALELREVAVERLAEGEAHALALAALGERAPALPERAAAIARESGGWPFFIRELCRFSEELEGSGEPGGEPLSLEGMLGARVGALPDGARRLLEVIAVAGQPIERGAAAKAAELGDDEPKMVGLLRRQRWLRVRKGRGRDEIEAYHDRIREAVFERLAPDAKRGHHLRLAEALDATGRADAETLAVHFGAAGDGAKAAEHSVKAADQALEALGFDRAARLYRQAIASIGEGDPRRRALHEKLGVALGNAGRGAEAALAYLSAVEGTSAELALELHRRAAEHYLASGHIDEGLVVLRSVLAATGMSMPATQLGAVLRMLPFLVLLWWQGIRFRERPASEIPGSELLRIDVCGGVAVNLFPVDPVVAVYFQRRFAWLALRSGEPHRVLRALIYEAMVTGLRGNDVPSAFEEDLWIAALSLVERHHDVSGRFHTGRGVILTSRSRFREARAELERAESEMRESGLGLSNDLSISRLYLIQALYFLGEWKELASRQAFFIEDARARGDLSLEVMLSSLTGFLPALMANQPEAARELNLHTESRWPRAGDFQGFSRLLAAATTEQYRQAGKGDGTLAVMVQRWPALQRSHMLRLSLPIRGQSLHLRGGARLAAAAVAAPTRRAELLRAVEGDARALGRVASKAAPTFASCLRAGVAASLRHTERAILFLAEAEAGFAAIDMAVFAAAARRRRGELLAGDEGRALIESADAVMRAQEIQNPARMTASLFPGTW